MVNGLEIFRQYFHDNRNDYILIGGVACDLILNSIERDFRPTMDFDIVIVSENLKSGFGQRLKDFIRDGGYIVQSRKSANKPTFFRFVNPQNGDFPSQLELASNKPADDWASHFAPLDIGDAKSSLSAILFEPEYYNFILNNAVDIDGITTISLEGLIPLKALAYLELSKIEAPTEKNIIALKKHGDDILMLAEILSTEHFDLPLTITNNLRSAVAILSEHASNNDQQERLELIRRFYRLS